MKLTPAPRRALEVLAIDGTARRLSITDRTPHRYTGGREERAVRWQAADWLVAHGLATARSWHDDGTYAGAGELIEITAAGREALR